MQNLDREAWLVRLYRSFCNSIYGRFAFLYDLTSAVVSLGQWSRWRCLSFDFMKGKKILEIGFGTGALQIELARRGYESYGLEYSSDMQKITSKKIDRDALQSHRVQADGMRMPFEHKSFDSLIATFPEQYIAQPETLKECYRILKDDGVVVIIGRWIELRSRILQACCPVFFRRPSEQEVNKLKQNFYDAGLEMKVIEVLMGFVLHRVVVAGKIQRD